ncbi:chitinase-like protein 1 [Hibiscus syriacus]|uniref:chitinase-like protein 1 n=1 Tax=Hibiscus syriacus TaxID=106335 RepID=UPI001923D029|nr:chitinase-like protein 1 [Hibiscus syriacus]
MNYVLLFQCLRPLRLPASFGTLSLTAECFRWLCNHRNYSYGAAGDGIKVDLLHHPEYLEQNATIAFQAAIWRWMTPIKKNQPSAQDIFVGNWKPTKNDTLAKRGNTFGTTMNVLYGEYTRGQGDINPMNTIISHYLYYLDLLGVGREQAGLHDELTCAEQEAFNPASSPKTVTSS